MDKPWRPEDAQWMRQREQEWESFGQEIQQKMIEADEFRYGSHTPDDFRQYFFTGEIPEGMEIPVHFEIMSYPLENDVEFVKSCLDALEDGQVNRLLRRIDRCYYKNNKSFAQVIYSREFTERLERLELREFRDRKTIGTPTFSRVIGAYNEPDDFRIGFEIHLLDDYVSIALDCIQSETDTGFSGVIYLMRQCAHFMQPTGMPEDDTVARRYAERFCNMFDTELPQDHLLFATWMKVKNCRFELGEKIFDESDFSDDELAETRKAQTEELKAEPEWIPRMSKASADYLAALKKLVGYLREYEICDSSEPFDNWPAVDVSALLSTGAKQYFSLAEQAIPAYCYSFKISNCAFIEKNIEPGELSVVSLFVIPESLNPDGSFERASILLLQQNGSFQFDYSFPSDISSTFNLIIKWLNSKVEDGLYAYKADRYGETVIPQNERDEDFESFGYLYADFDLLCEDVEHLGPELECLKPVDSTAITGLTLNLDD